MEFQIWNGLALTRLQFFTNGTYTRMFACMDVPNDRCYGCSEEFPDHFECSNHRKPSLTKKKLIKILN